MPQDKNTRKEQRKRLCDNLFTYLTVQNSLNDTLGSATADRPPNDVTRLLTLTKEWRDSGDKNAEASQTGSNTSTQTLTTSIQNY